jgi:hypothetical protein
MIRRGNVSKEKKVIKLRKTKEKAKKDLSKRTVHIP